MLPASAKPVLKQGTRKKICHHDGRTKKTPPHSWALNFHFGPFFLDSDTCQIFRVSQKSFLDKILSESKNFQQKLAFLGVIIIVEHGLIFVFHVKHDIYKILQWSNLYSELWNFVFRQNAHLKPDQSILMEIWSWFKIWKTLKVSFGLIWNILANTWSTPVDLKANKIRGFSKIRKKCTFSKIRYRIFKVWQNNQNLEVFSMGNIFCKVLKGVEG